MTEMVCSNNNNRIDEFSLLSKKIILIFFIVGMLAVLVCYFIGIPILNFIYQLDLQNYKTDLLVLVASAVSYALVAMISSFLTILKNNTNQSIIYLAVSILSTFLSVFTINRNGISGAAFAFSISGVILLVSYLILLYKAIKKERIRNAKN